MPLISSVMLVSLITFGAPVASCLNEKVGPQALFQLPHSRPGSVSSYQPVLEARGSM